MLYMYCSLIRAGSVLLFASLPSGIKLIQLAEITQQELATLKVKVD